MKNKWSRGIIFCAALVASSGTALCAEEAPQAVRKVTIDEAVALAMENNISLSSSAIDLRIKQRANDLSWNVFLPSVQTTGTIARSNNVGSYDWLYAAMGNPVSGHTEIEYWSAIGGLDVSLTLNLALMESLKATRQSYEAGLITWEQARNDTEMNVRKAFYGILLQEGSLSLSKGKLATSEERMRQTRIDFQNGRVPELSYLQTQLAVEMQQPQIMEAELTLTHQKELFAFLLGLPIGTEIELDGTIAPKIQKLDADTLVSQNLAGNLTIAALGKNMELLDTQVSALKFQRYTPTLILGKTWQPVHSDFDSNWLDGDNWTDSSGSFTMTLAFNLTNLLPFSSSGNTFANTLDQKTQMQMAMNQLAYTTELEVRNLVSKLDKTRSSIAAMELSVNIADKAYRLSEEGYRAGTIEYLDLKDAENSLLGARLGVLSEKFNYLSTMLDLESALNTKLDQGK